MVGNRDDYQWAQRIIRQHDLPARCPVLLCPVFGELEPAELAQWILQDRLRVRLGLQLHKLIWSPTMRGV